MLGGEDDKDQRRLSDTLVFHWQDQGHVDTVYLDGKGQLDFAFPVSHMWSWCPTWSPPVWLRLVSLLQCLPSQTFQDLPQIPTLGQHYAPRPCKTCSHQEMPEEHALSLTAHRKAKSNLYLHIKQNNLRGLGFLSTQLQTQNPSQTVTSRLIQRLKYTEQSNRENVHTILHTNRHQSWIHESGCFSISGMELPSTAHWPTDCKLTIWTIARAGSSPSCQIQEKDCLSFL